MTPEDESLRKPAKVSETPPITSEQETRLNLMRDILDDLKQFRESQVKTIGRETRDGRNATEDIAGKEVADFDNDGAVRESDGYRQVPEDIADRVVAILNLQSEASKSVIRDSSESPEVVEASDVEYIWWLGWVFAAAAGAWGLTKKPK